MATVTVDNTQYFTGTQLHRNTNQMLGIRFQL